MLKNLLNLLFGNDDEEDYSLGHVVTVENLEAYRSANKEYLHVKIVKVNNIVHPPMLETHDLLMTHKELERMIERAEKNTEDY